MRFLADENSFTANTSYRSPVEVSRDDTASGAVPVSVSVSVSASRRTATTPAALRTSLRPRSAAPVTNASSSGDAAWYSTPATPPPRRSTSSAGVTV